MAPLNPGPGGYLLVTRVVSLMGLLSAVASVVCGGLGIYFVDYAGDVAKWPTRSGSGIWCGTTMFVTCIVGVIASFCKYSSFTGNFQAMCILHLMGILATTALAGVNLRFSIDILVDWTSDLQMWFCVGDYPGVVAMASMNLIISVVLLTLCVGLSTSIFFAMHYVHTGRSPIASRVTPTGVDNKGFAAEKGTGTAQNPSTSMTPWASAAAPPSETIYGTNNMEQPPRYVEACDQ